LGWEAWLTLENKPLPICYHVQFGSTVTKGVGINRKETTKIVERCGTAPFAVGTWLTHRNTPPPHVCYPAE